MYTIYALCQTGYEWIDYVSIGKADTIEEAKQIGEKCDSKYWGIRLSSDTKPCYVLGDDKKWIDV